MDPVDEILAEILASPEAEWYPALEAACGRRPDLAAETRRRFRTLEQSGILRPVASPFAAAEAQVPEHLGPFRLLRRLGSGGMGHVWLARDEALHRDVAVKVVRPERLLFSNARERFRREVESVARLRHHGCVQILHVGEHAEAPFFAMEYVRGASLDAILAWIRDQNPSAEPARLSGAEVRRALAARGEEVETAATELFAAPWNRFCVSVILAATEALAHAHARGVVHRDVKPSNLMVSPEGRVVVIDFGLALADGSGSLTKEGSLLGSLSYMAPEQIRGDLDAVGPRTDVYGLGTCLYELLTLTPAFPARDELSLRQDALSGRCVPLQRRNANTGQDLAVVVQCAMHVDPERRYASALEFASDLVAVLHDRPIRARRDAFTMRARRWSRRHPALATAGLALVLAALLVPTLVSFGIAGERDRARLAEGLALRREYAANIAAARAALIAGDGASARLRLGACAPELRGFEWHHLALELEASLATFRVGPDPVVRVCHRKGVFAAADTKGRVVAARLDDPRSMRALGTVPRVVGMALSEDATELVVLDEGGGLSVLDVQRGGVVRTRPRGSPSERIRLPEAGGSIAMEVDGERVHFVDPRTLQPGPPRRVDALASSVHAEFRTSESELAISSALGITIVDATGKASVTPFGGGVAHGILGASEGFRRIALGSEGRVTIWQRDGAVVHVALDGAIPLAAVFPSDETKVLVVSRTGVATLHDLSGTRAPRTLHGHDGPVTAEAPIAGTNTLLTGGRDGTVRLWSTELVNHLDELSEIGEGKAIWSGADGQLLLGDDSASVFRVAPETGTASWSADQGHWVITLGGGLQGGRVVSTRGRGLHFWGAERGEPIRHFPLPGGSAGICRLLVLPSGREVVVGTVLGEVILVDVVTHEVRATRTSHAESVVALVWDEARGRVLSAGAEGSVESHEPGEPWTSRRLFETGRPLRSMALHGEALFCGEGETNPAREVLAERDARDGRLRREASVSRALNAIRTLGSERVVTGSRGGSVTIWDRVQLQPLLDLPLFALTVQDLAIGPADEWIAAVGYGGAPKLLRAVAAHGAEAAGLRSARRATAEARAAALRAMREEIWPPAARSRLEQDRNLDPEVRAQAIRMLPPRNRWGILSHALQLTVEAPRAGLARAELTRVRQRLEDAVKAPVAGHETMARIALAMVCVRLGLAKEVLEALAEIPSDEVLGAEAGTRSLLPFVHFTRGSALAALGERARADLEAQKLRDLVQKLSEPDPEAHLLLRQLEAALR